MFARYLQPSEQTDFILRIIEGMQDFSIYNKQLVGSVVAGITGESSRWLVDMPKIMSSLYKTLHFISWDSAWQWVGSLLLRMLEQYPEKAVRLLLDTAPPGDSSCLEMWEMMLSTPLAVDKVLVLLFKELQERKQKMLFCTLTEDISCLALLASIYLPGEHFARTYEFYRFLRHQSQDMLSVALRGVATMSRIPEMARKMKVLLPDLLEVLEQGNEDLQLKALRVCRNVLRELRREEATPMAVELLDKLLPLFDNELFSELREISISLFTELLKKVAGKCKRQMKKRVRRGLLPLWFHMSDETRSVAEASSQALLAAAELLKWQQLRDLVQTGQTWRIGECLLLQDRTRAEDYLDQSQGYLDNAQDTLRMEAIRFMGLAARGQSQQNLLEMMSALYPLEHDCTPSIRCLATQTISILSSVRMKAEQRRTKRPWCC
ncbi:maestro heat-like repeat-containing protein family member 6 [Heliangelus exortis]|uniref:maestro heat-like repeat-containing protein family member 6 n=1 Tax=Heliangelus exortis TaxID=472823 RepID=UPI003A8E35D5